jgi:hypothetical protein
MITSWKHVTRWMSVSLSSLLLVLLLAACGGGSSSAATPTAQPPTATPTTAPTTAASTQMKTYTGTDFSIEYPASWTLQNTASTVVFTDAQKLNTLTFVTGPNPGGAISASQQASAALALLESSGRISNPQPVSLPATATVAGVSWAQRGITGTVTANGVTGPAEIIMLANNHPASSPTTKTYEIYYGGPTLSFQQENALVFQPMLQTFKFAS